ncbi:C40 family peptidase [Paenibacillus mesophilus]|uniref:C40 family peptidase n=1 Tax=Paenibacillus mesophilus TaxID=2582849 RepID=UPI00130532FE|nr:C40 family peptidase [Paenibacillus mesophilus]
MKNRRKYWAISLLAVVMAATTACSGFGGMTGKTRQSAPVPQTPPSAPGTPGALSGPNVNMLNTDEGRIPIVQLDGKSYISAQKLAELLEYQTDWNAAAGKLRMGDNSAEFELTGGSNQAVKEGNNVALPDVPKVAEGALHIPVDALPDLFREDISYELRNGEVALHPSPGTINRAAINEPSETEGQADELSFGDDPADPFKTPSTPAGSAPPFADEAEAVSAIPADYGDAIPVLKNIDMNKLISTAERYMGVKYLFGADPYAKSGKFDCSTFSQYVYGKQGISLPRTARAQARQGVWVSRKMLRKGDLMFFYVPGRFKSNKTVGHVGIYMGNNKMIHSSPAPDNGVQISNINKAYWKKTFLTAKRVGT